MYGYAVFGSSYDAQDHMLTRMLLVVLCTVVCLVSVSVSVRDANGVGALSSNGNRAWRIIIPEHFPGFSFIIATWARQSTQAAELLSAISL
jgi:hypothetical protein